MGRGTRHRAAAMGAMRGDESGEIAFTDADRLEDHEQASARVNNGSGAAFADEDGRADARAVMRLAKALKPKFPGRDGEAMRDLAQDLYAQMSQKALSGQMTSPELTRFAALVGEQPGALMARLKRS